MTPDRFYSVVSSHALQATRGFDPNHPSILLMKSAAITPVCRAAATPEEMIWRAGQLATADNFPDAFVRDYCLNLLSK